MGCLVCCSQVGRDGLAGVTGVEVGIWCLLLMWEGLVWLFWMDAWIVWDYGF